MNSFALTARQWIEKTGAIGILSKPGRYGGTFAHKDIAFEFATWISVEFKLFLIKEFQRLREDRRTAHQATQGIVMRDTDHRAALAGIKTFPQLIAYLRDEMGWSIANGDAFEDLTFDCSPEELGIDPKTAAKIASIKRLRPLSLHQPWGIFFVKFEPEKAPRRGSAPHPEPSCSQEAGFR